MFKSTIGAVALAAALAVPTIARSEIAIPDTGADLHRYYTAAARSEGFASRYFPLRALPAGSSAPNLCILTPRCGCFALTSKPKGSRSAIGARRNRRTSRMAS
jgi:hypothetical protein